LAAKLTGWRIDIKSESQARDEREGYTVHAEEDDGGVAMAEDLEEDEDEHGGMEEASGDDDVEASDEHVDVDSEAGDTPPRDESEGKAEQG